MNDKGQVMVEGLFVGLIFIVSLFFFLRYAMMVQRFFLVDEFIEQALICLVESKTNCESRLRQQAIDLQFSAISIQSNRTDDRAQIQLGAVSPFGAKIQKESELKLDLKVAK